MGSGVKRYGLTGRSQRWMNYKYAIGNTTSFRNSSESQTPARSFGSTISWGRGKSYLARLLCCNYGAIEMPNKTAEIYYLYQGQPIIIWDLARRFKNASLMNQSRRSRMDRWSVLSTHRNKDICPTSCCCIRKLCPK